MANRQTRGRQRIPISRIQNQDDLYATFSKRSCGLYKKASELSTLCGADIGVIIFSPTNAPYSFFHPTMESVVNRYINPTQPQDNYTRIVESATRSRIDDLNIRLDETQDGKQALEEEIKHLEEIEKSQRKGWWEEPIESLNREEMKEWIDWFQAFKAQIGSRIEQLQNGASTSAPNPPNFSDIVGPSTQVDPGQSSIGIDQFSSNYFGILDVAQDPLYANQSGYHSSQYFLPEDPSFDNYVFQDPPTAVGSGYIPNYFVSSMSSHQAMEGGSGHVSSHSMNPQPLQDPFIGGGRSGQVSSHSMYLQPLQDPFSGGGGSGQVSTQFFNSSSSQDLSSDGRNLADLDQFFLFVPPLDPSTSGVGTDPLLGRYQYIHSQIQDPSTAGRSGASSSANQGQGGN